jgi:glycosyltransferase involved in cell wall biosynthesis
MPTRLKDFKLQKLELIVVNDDSKDDSLRIAMKYGAFHKYIFI